MVKDDFLNKVVDFEEFYAKFAMEKRNCGVNRVNDELKNVEAIIS
ncbi:MAG TPA: hypothetical protein PKA44_11355 [Saprospiraceae bacterium]|jgi:hypothetical protein|nr:hypothetical protein [Saprospiraceae bacterium]HQU95600.1 hypothetical protein [Saprospiraceae bacterium]HQW94713.1 hypothetical protein [Saprospiraceae bacterium]